MVTDNAALRRSDSIQNPDVFGYSDHFQVLGLLGRTERSEVWKVRHRRSGELFAVKRQTQVRSVRVREGGGSRRCGGRGVRSYGASGSLGVIAVQKLNPCLPPIAAIQDQNAAGALPARGQDGGRATAAPQRGGSVPCLAGGRPLPYPGTRVVRACTYVCARPCICMLGGQVPEPSRAGGRGGRGAAWQTMRSPLPQRPWRCAERAPPPASAPPHRWTTVKVVRWRRPSPRLRAPWAAAQACPTPRSGAWPGTWPAGWTFCTRTR